MTTKNHTPASRRTKTPIQQRRLKVRRACHSYQLEQYGKPPTPVGEIHIKGHWLIQAGFDINQSVTVRIMHGCLVVTAE